MKSGGAYYNDNDRRVCEWLRQLAAAGQISAGTVDERPIEDVLSNDLAGYERAHFFAGIGGWEYALGLAGWSGPVWTGSCPCQPFSIAGQGKGTEDKRHVWPIWRDLIAQSMPTTIFGEQVASPAGRLWLAGIQTDLEALGYRFGAADLCAASVGAPHIRQRFFWVADANDARSTRGPETRGSDSRAEKERSGVQQPERSLSDSGVANANPGRRTQCRRGRKGVYSKLEPRQGSAHVHTTPSHPGTSSGHSANPWADAELIPCGDGKARRIKPGLEPLAYGVSGRVGLLRGYGNAIVPQVAATFIRAYMETKGE